MNRQIQHFWIIFRTEYFNKKHLDCAVDFFRKYDRISANAHDVIINDILNTIFSEEEIKYAINYLKNNKSPRIDGIPAELIKACKKIYCHRHYDYTELHKWKCEFPANWSIGIRSPVHKSCAKSIVDDYKGTTILPVMEKYLRSLLTGGCALPMKYVMKSIDTTGDFCKCVQQRTICLFCVGLLINKW